jgi:hypothetical protein
MSKTGRKWRFFGRFLISDFRFENHSATSQTGTGEMPELAGTAD